MKKTYLSALLIGLTSTVGFSQAVQTKMINQIKSLEGVNYTPLSSPNINTKALGVELWSDDFTTGVNWTAAAVENPTGGTMGTVLPTFGWEIGTTSNSWWTQNGFATGINGSAGGFAEVNNGNYNTNNQAVNVTYTLTSPVFDIPNLPANTGNVDGVLLTFKQFGALFNDAQTVEITTDGSTWEEVFTNDGRTAFVGNNPTAIYANPETINVNLAPWTVGNASMVQIRFKWTSAIPGNQTLPAWTTFGWYIDDVSISTLPTNEIALGKSWHGDIFNDWEYSMMPLTQAREMIAGVVVSNNSATDLTAVVSCEIHDAAGVVATPSDISQLIPVGITDTIWFNTGFTPSANGVYHAEFSVPTDDIPTNNTSITSTLTINDYLMAHDYGSTTTFGWSGTGANSDLADAVHSWGEIYSPTVTQDVYGMDVWIGTGTTVGNYLLAQVYQIDPNNDGSWIQDPLSPVMAQVEINVAAGNVNALTNVVFPSGITLEAGKSYIFEIQKADGTTGTSFYIGGSNASGEDDDNSAVGYGDYSASPGNVTYFTGWDGGFYIRPNFQNTAGLVETSMNGISIFPNPTAGKLTVTNTNNYNNVIEVVNLAGKVVYSGTSNKTEELNITGNGAGVYFVTITNELGSVTEKVILK